MEDYGLLQNVSFSSQDVFFVVRIAFLYPAVLAVLLVVYGRRFGHLQVVDVTVLLMLFSTVLAALAENKNIDYAILAAVCVILAFYLLMQRIPAFRSTYEPTLLVYRGQILDEQLKREGIKSFELKQALYALSFTPNDLIMTAVLETDGSLTVLGEESSTLRTFERLHSRRNRRADR